MKQYICTICGYIYEETSNGSWEALPDGWKCPVCGAGKDAFIQKEERSKTAAEISKPEADRELSPMEMSVICSNLARGCEKQYLFTQAEDFKKLAEFFKSSAMPAEQPSLDGILALIEKDLASGYPYGNILSESRKDRGSLRALAWSEKVTRMLQSLLARYRTEGEQMLQNTRVYVCTVCGFVYVGDAPPEICPVCKVPSWKFEKVEGRSDK